jgi:alkylation response protein AidB-like acyl-CoA dehydrogenase
LTEREDEIRELGRRLADALHRFEIPVDEANDAVPPELEREIRDLCLASGLFAPNFPVELGGAGLTLGSRCCSRSSSAGSRTASGRSCGGRPTS